VQCRPRPFPFEDRHLLPKGEDFQCQIGPTTEEDADGRKERRYDAEHDSTFVATRHSNCAQESKRADFNTVRAFGYKQLPLQLPVALDRSLMRQPVGMAAAQ
jgi:hypothetical protein